jgi:hypothetical protein
MKQARHKTRAQAVGFIIERNHDLNFLPGIEETN